MPLSTNSVFHFTKSLEILTSIIKNNFKIKYCLETIESKTKTLQYAVPMVSFCDIPLSQVTSHIDKYGGYGIGLYKRWAKRKGLNPVLYIERQSNILNEILIKEKIENLNDRNNSDYKLIQEFLRYTKNVEGKLIRGGEEVQKKYIYFDEREWRYCPTNSELGVNLPHIIHQINFYQENKKIINESASNIKLNFNLNDISYIIVQNEEDIITLINNLKNLNFLNNENATVFSSRIITTKQIKNDF